MHCAIATFQHPPGIADGDHTYVPNVDVIVTSNVMDIILMIRKSAIVSCKKCNFLFISVPLKERLSQDGEHVNSYDEHSQ